MSEKSRKLFAPVRIGLKEHHPYMTMAEIAVFEHLNLSAIRTEDFARKRGFPVGFVEGATGNSIARDMGKSRGTVHRALKGLEWNEKTGRHYITRYPQGILIHNYDGTEYAENRGEKKAKGGSNTSWAGSEPAQIEPSAGSDRAQGWLKSSPVPAQIEPDIKEERLRTIERKNAIERCEEDHVRTKVADPTGVKWVCPRACGWERPFPQGEPERPCTRDHEKEKVGGGLLWYCPDSCGWWRRIPKELARG